MRSSDIYFLHRKLRRTEANKPSRPLDSVGLDIPTPPSLSLHTHTHREIGTHEEEKTGRQDEQVEEEDQSSDHSDRGNPGAVLHEPCERHFPSLVEVFH